MKSVKFAPNGSFVISVRRVFGLAVLLVVGTLWYYLAKLAEPEVVLSTQPRVLLWWTETAFQIKPEIRYCGLHLCTITNDRRLLPEAKVVLFYGSNINVYDLPLPRRPGQLWALLHEESPRNVPYLLFEDALRHFNYTSTFSRHSDFPLTTLSLPNSQNLLSMNYMMSLGQKNSLRTRLSPIMFLQSNCDTMSGRTEYVRELMSYINVDSYGSCLHNRDMPPRLQKDYLNNLHSPELYRFMSQYKFVLAYENGICNDYITEKYWRPLIVGSIPIYFGSPSIRDWEPHNKSSIYISDFNSPKELAEFVQNIDDNDKEYLKYLRHKYNQIQPITNYRLEMELLYREPTERFFDDFACAMCGKIQEDIPNNKTASRLQYDCPMAAQYPRMQTQFNKSNNQWYSIAKTGGCMAAVLDKLLRRNRKYASHKFDQLLNDELNAGKCESRYETEYQQKQVW